jgi:hypothetical protein
MTNLLEETKEILEENGKVLDDVEWVGCTTSGWFNYEFHGIKAKTEFIEWANFEYDSGYGGEEVASSLKVMGDDWWLERHEYDGSEWWEFKTMPKKEDFK